jgi:hypothetical protein
MYDEDTSSLLGELLPEILTIIFTHIIDTKKIQTYLALSRTNKKFALVAKKLTLYAAEKFSRTVSQCVWSSSKETGRWEVGQKLPNGRYHGKFRKYWDSKQTDLRSECMYNNGCLRGFKVKYHEKTKRLRTIDDYLDFAKASYEYNEEGQPVSFEVAGNVEAYIKLIHGFKVECGVCQGKFFPYEKHTHA